MWFVLLSIVAILIYWKLTKPLNFWKKKGIPYQKRWPISRNVLEFGLKPKSVYHPVDGVYNVFPNERYFGTHQFSKPVLVVRDLNLIKQITVKDFDHFTDRKRTGFEDVNPLLSRNLYSLRGQHWRDMRATLSPLFTGAKMRKMYSLLRDCGEQFTEYFQKQNTDVITIEVSDTFSRFTNDAIASVDFGLKVDSLKDKENVFYLMGQDATISSGFIENMKFILVNLSPGLAKLLKVQFFSRQVSTFFRSIIREAIKYREEEGPVRPDMINLLMEARKRQFKHEDAHETNGDADFATVEKSGIGKVQKHRKLDLSDEAISAQVLMSLLNGFETSATLMSVIAYELAVNPEIQRKLQAEIDEVTEQCEGKITYEALVKMKYLDMVVSETLRKWPPVCELNRVCVKEYTISPEKPTEKPLTLEKGQWIMIPVRDIHHNQKYFPNPEKFDPERFNDENKHNIESSSYMPFGAGPRSCIALRHADLKNKTLICQLLSKFDIVPVKETVIPLKMGVESYNFMPDGGLWLGLQQR